VVLVTVVVPARNAEATIGRALAALADQRLDQQYEVVVVDSGSSDRTRAVVEASELRATLLDNPGGEPAGSRNLGVARARGRLIAFTDADCEPEPGWLAAGVRALAGADLVQGRVVPARAAGPFDRTVSVGRDHGLYETANLFVRRETFERVGGFEPVAALERTERQPFGEDAWFAWRAKRAGASCTFAADAVVRHAVFERGAGEYIAERARCRMFPPLVAQIPELRRQFLHRRIFLSPDSARFDLALAGLLAARISGRRTPTLLATLPYAAAVLGDARRSRPGERLLTAGARVAADALTLAALARGSVDARTVVL
jgi:glycosyltransferase involved in cell wall biosynthesis